MMFVRPLRPWERVLALPAAILWAALWPFVVGWRLLKAPRR